MTPQRHAIIHVLCNSGEHLTPNEVYEQAREELTSLTETTVYRTLEFLAENRLVHPAHMISGHLGYQIAGHEHHHLVCRNCGNAMELEHSLFKGMYQKLETTSGYKLTDSHLTFFGLCPNCQ